MVDEVTTSSQAKITKSTFFYTCVGNEVELIPLAREDEVTILQTLPVNVVKITVLAVYSTKRKIAVFSF